MRKRRRSIYAFDVGSTIKGNFAWVRFADPYKEPAGNASIDDLVKHLIDDMANGVDVALGVESPTFLPIPDNSEDLSRGRFHFGKKGEGGRSMFAPPGLSSATLGIHQLVWVLKMIREGGEYSQRYIYTIDFESWQRERNRDNTTRALFLWEAFVSGSAHSEQHIRDAATAAHGFVLSQGSFADANAITVDRSMNLVHACALRTGWAHDIERLAAQCLVIRPKVAYAGGIHDPIPNPENAASS